MIKEIKNLYEKILELNLQINLMLNNFPKDDFESFNENLQDFLEQKDIFIQKLISLSKTANEEDLKEISERVHKIEEENLRLIQEKKHYLSTEINKTAKTVKALSAYKFDKQNTPRIFDETD